MRVRWTFASLLLLLLPSDPASQCGAAQKLYDKKRDDQAQEAKTRAFAIGSSDLIGTMPKNVHTLAAQDIEIF
jgi:hypothetical protein